MKAITILQPYASLIVEEIKKYETRGWPTNFRGPIAIHAGKQNLFNGLDFVTAAEIQNALPVLPELLPTGAVIAIADLVDCIEMTDEFIKSLPRLELLFGYYKVGRYAWHLENIRPIVPVPAKGMQRIWNWEGKYGIYDTRCRL